jgi:hypothetical protein
MINEKAIAILESVKKRYIKNGLVYQAVNQAIVALEQAPPEPEPELWIDAEWPRDADSPPKKARFSNNGNDWIPGILVGKGPTYWVDGDYRLWNFCQVDDK